jgi:FixJ family two-component response regulator
MGRTVVAVVDEDLGVRTAIARLLRAHGFHVQSFASAEAFLAVGSGSQPACLVLDMRLKGMSGMELRRHLDATGSRLPVIFMTTADDPATLQEAVAAGCVACLQKPFAARLLIDAVNKAVGR